MSVWHEIPASIIKLYKAHQEMCRDLNHSRLKFTLDGRLLGDIGELIVERYYGMRATGARTPGVDGTFPDSEKTIQVKATQSNLAGPAFSFGRGQADHLMFLWLDFANGRAEVVYNGPEAPVRKELKGDYKSTASVKLHIVRALNERVHDQNRLKPI